jgi:hypothetical protein
MFTLLRSLHGESCSIALHVAQVQSCMLLMGVPSCDMPMSAASSAEVRDLLRSEQLRTAVAAVDSADRPEQVHQEPTHVYHLLCWDTKWTDRGSGQVVTAA